MARYAAVKIKILFCVVYYVAMLSYATSHDRLLAQARSGVVSVLACNDSMVILGARHNRLSFWIMCSI